MRHENCNYFKRSGLLVLIISSISINLITQCYPTSATPTKTKQEPTPDSTLDPTSDAAAIFNGFLSTDWAPLQPFSDGVGEMTMHDLDNLHRLIANTFDFYQAILSRLEKEPFFAWKTVKNSIDMVANFCKAAFVFAKGVKIAPKFPIEDNFFESFAAIGTEISTRANELIAAGYHTKANVHKALLKLRAEKIMENLHKIIGNSNYGLYLKWDQLRDMENLDEPGKRFNMVEEMADVLAQLRVAGIFHDVEIVQSIFKQLKRDNRRELEKLLPGTADGESDDGDHSIQCRTATD